METRQAHEWCVHFIEEEKSIVKFICLTCGGLIIIIELTLSVSTHTLHLPTESFIVHSLNSHTHVYVYMYIKIAEDEPTRCVYQIVNGHAVVCVADRAV